MRNITLSITDDLKKEMDKHPSVKWSAAVRSIIKQKLHSFEEAERIAKRSKLSNKEWKRIGPAISKKAAEHAEALLHESNR